MESPKICSCLEIEIAYLQMPGNGNCKWPELVFANGSTGQIKFLFLVAHGPGWFWIMFVILCTLKKCTHNVNQNF